MLSIFAPKAHSPLAERMLTTERDLQHAMTDAEVYRENSHAQGKMISKDTTLYIFELYKILQNRY
jgi:hypothetical protein